LNEENNQDLCFFYKNAQERDRLVASENGNFLIIVVQKIVEFTGKVCSSDSQNKSFVIINQKG
jgi:hypothetical protein